MKECSKSIARRLADSNFSRRYFVGHGVDIGGKPDPLSLYREFFVRLDSVRTWDWEDGDAQFMSGIADASFDFVHSSHCLEHLQDPIEGIRNWFRVLKPNGHLVVTVPDEDLYEQDIFPSTMNRDHKWSFTVYKERSWNPRSINVLDLVRSLGAAADLVKLELLTSTYRFALPRYDQTMTPVGECGVEFVIRKRTEREATSGTRDRASSPVPRETRIHLNQYRDDMATLKQTNSSKPPFTNDADL